MIKQLLIPFLFFNLLWGAQAVEENIVEIVADKFEIYQNSNLTKFIGKVLIKQKKDSIYADFVNVIGDKNNKPVKYEAINNVRFEFYSGKSHYKGSSQLLDYLPLTQQYILKGKAVVYELSTNKTLKGDRIIINMTTGKSEVFSDKEPVKFIFDSKK